MIAFPDILATMAEQAGMKVPENVEEYDKAEYPHFHVYCTLQIGAPMPHTDSHWTNARIIAGLTEEQVKTYDFNDFVKAGLEIGRPIP